VRQPGAYIIASAIAAKTTPIAINVNSVPETMVLSILMPLELGEG
jgi:hypothetical protein